MELQWWEIVCDYCSMFEVGGLFNTRYEVTDVGASEPGSIGEVVESSCPVPSQQPST